MQPVRPHESAESAAPAPLIGVTGPDRGGYPAWFFTRRAIRRAGGRAVRITPGRPVPAHLLDTLGGFVLGGGADVTEPLSDEPAEPRRASPQKRWHWRVLDNLLGLLALLLRLLWGTRRHGPDPARDILELEILEHARRRGLPVLGICRGAQLMNVAEGGTLLRDLREFYEERPELYTVLPRRKVLLSESSQLARIVGTEPLLVNSLHFHAVRDAAHELRIAARETSGVIQAIEHPVRAFWIGVQWHPEYLPQRPRHQRLFRALVECARQAATEERLREPGTEVPEALRAQTRVWARGAE